MDTPAAHIWAERCRAAAEATIPHDSLGELVASHEAFIDEAGVRLPVDSMLIRAAAGARCESRRLDDSVSSAPDLALWTLATLGADGPLPGLVERILASAPHGPLLELPERTAIEVVTEIELSTLHALWALRGHDVRIVPRCLNAADWHRRTLQPDNATNLPWAIHVFVIAAIVRRDPEFDIEAQMRLHNAMATGSRPNRRAALILHHAADELRRWRRDVKPPAAGA